MSYAMLDSVTVRLIQNFKNSPKIGVKEIFNFFWPMTWSGSWTFIKFQVQRYCLCSLGAFRQQTDGRTDRRHGQFPGALYFDTTPNGV